MNSEAKRQLETLLRSVAAASRSLLMLDYDGTLAPFRKHRELAFPYPGVSLVLQSLVRSGNTRVVIISGRNAHDLISLLDIDPHPEIWGLHGLQRLKTDGSVIFLPLEKRTVEGLSTAERWLRHEHLHDKTEFKAASIAVHWRGMAPVQAQSVREHVLRGWTPIANFANLHLLEFDGGLEIRAPEADKGYAVRTLLQETNSADPVAYLGDDTTDEHAFEAIAGRGLSMLVRPQWRETAAQVWLRPPQEILDLLTRWLNASRQQNASHSKTSMEVNA